MQEKHQRQLEESMKNAETLEKYTGMYHIERKKENRIKSEIAKLQQNLLQQQAVTKLQEEKLKKALAQLIAMSRKLRETDEEIKYLLLINDLLLMENLLSNEF